MIRPPLGGAPSVLLPLAYMVAAVLAFALAAAGVPGLARELAGHYYHPRLFALTHAVTLGWITLTIMGASYQLVPIVLERPIWSERLARWQLPALVAGIIGMVGHFWIGHWSGLVWGAGLVGLGTLAHLINVGLSLRGLARWTFTARLMALGYAGLALTAAFGLLLGVDRVRPFLPGGVFPRLHAHVHLALLGWVAPMVVGVAARVYPMFLLAREPGGWSGRVQLWGFALGVPAVVAGLLVEASALVIGGALGVGAALAGHLAWVVAMARGRKRPSLDWGLRFALTGSGFLVPAAVLGLGFALGLLAGPRLGLAYTVLALGGWVSLTIVGMMLKIVPFLVWYRVYAPLAGRRPVPTFAQLAWPRAEAAAYVLLTGGMAALAVAVAAGAPVGIRAAGLAVAGGALAFGAAIARVLDHLRPGGRVAAPAGAVAHAS
ncbi:MAG: hypothetical protein HY728_03465 [Candidatus Rokubacteria bacterium]|nr:hypothetical protein [Candidatus Rokubacteria bacterium]